MKDNFKGGASGSKIKLVVEGGSVKEAGSETASNRLV